LQGIGFDSIAGFSMEDHICSRHERELAA